MSYTYYPIETVANFDALGVVRQNYQYILGDQGVKEIAIVKKRYYSVIIDDLFLPVGLNDRNGFNFKDHTALISEGIIYVGFNDED